MKGLKKLTKRFETLMTATTFAEAGEFETAREILKEDVQPEEKTAPSGSGQRLYIQSCSEPR